MSETARVAARPRVLVVDDDASLRESICAYLSAQDFDVSTAENAAAMDRLLESELVDVVVLDVMMPGEDGLSVCRRLRDRGGAAVVMLSAMGHEIDRIVGLELGADDYLPKPCNPRELLARIRAVLRRREADPNRAARQSTLYGFAGFHFDLARRQLRAPDGVVVLLTAGEFSLLRALAENAGRVISRDELLELARGDEADVFDRAVDVQISRLRRKLHACTDNELIRTLRGSGYMFDAAVSKR